MNPFFSVIIPTYNRPALVLKLVRELGQQKFQNFELIIVDDSLHDQNEQISTVSGQVVYLHRGKKLGVSSARNFGAAAAKGTYLAFLDDDDSVSKNWLSDFNDLIAERSAPDVLFCAMQRVDTKSRKKVNVYPHPTVSGGKWGGIIFPGAFALKKSFFDRIGGYDERLLFGENTELFLRVRSSNSSYSFTGNVNYYYFQSRDGGSKNLLNKVESNSIVLSKHADFFSKHKKVKKLFIQIIGVSLLKLNRVRDARSYLLRAYALNPFDLGALLRFLISLSPFLAKRIYRASSNQL